MGCAVGFKVLPPGVNHNNKKKLTSQLLLAILQVSPEQKIEKVLRDIPPKNLFHKVRPSMHSVYQGLLVPCTTQGLDQGLSAPRLPEHGVV